jgi:cytochrome P450 family 9
VDIVISTISLHRDPQYFSDPDRFDPERFNDENKGKILPGTYLPFGIGPRNCIGTTGDDLRGFLKR